MADQPATALPGTVAAPPARLEPDAIGVAQDTVIGMASSASAASVGLTLAALAAATAYGSGPILILTAIPMLVIANAYRRLNMWNANCGASFEWVGRAISPYLGFLTGWLMIAAYIIATVSGVEVLGPSVLAVAGANSSSTWANIGIGTILGLLMLVIAVVGIRMCADFGAQLAEFNGEANHVHLLVNFPPTVAISRLVNGLEGVSSRRLRQEFPDLRQHYWRAQRLW